MRKRRLLLVLTLFVLSFVWLAPMSTAADDATAKSLLDKLEWRAIGPAIMGGRIDDLAVVESDPRTIFLGTASAGVWKTTNNGVTWEALFQAQAVSTIGDITLAPSNPSIVWVGTGEPNNRQSSSWGNGVYRSNDGGKTWIHLGLEDTNHIGRIVVDPHDPNTAYVAAVGHLWGPNKDRGLYKTTDGGKTWTNTLFINEDTGFIDIAMDPESPNILYAAAYQRRRRVFGFSGGGPSSGLYRTVDGGENWTELTNGLPEGDTGRIGIDVYRKDPRIVYIVLENAKGGVFRSDDKGDSWTRMSDLNPRPMYYSKIRVDPLNDQRIWLLDARLYFSEDGGKNFVTERGNGIHSDHHAMWINPSDSNHVLIAGDGGFSMSYDQGRSWDFVDTMALGQFYEIGYDLEKPYRVYGGLQDNGSWSGPVRTLYRQGITNEDWTRVGGGDGFYTQIDPKDPTTVYVESQNGNLRRVNLETTEAKSIRPQPPLGEKRYRFDWNSPILISPHDSNTIYYGGNHLFKSTNRGDSWTASPDLTTNPDRDSMEIMGVVPNEKTLSRNDGISTYGQIISIAESPIRQGILYVGTDDGKLQVSRNGGETWSNVYDKIPGLPANTYCSRVVASAHAEGRVFATFDGHRNDHYGVYVYVSEDFGSSWKSIRSNIPEGHTLNVIREHPKKESLLFAGGEFGVYVSFNRGQEWHQFKGDFPTVPVDDIAIHPRDNDLLLGTHGRSIWVLDDMGPLVEWSNEIAESDLHVFKARDAVAYRIYNHKGNTGHKRFFAPNPPYGALIHYYLKTAPEEDKAVKVAILDEGGNLVRKLTGPQGVGLNRIAWDLRHEPPIPTEGQQGFRGPPPGPKALPGTYTVKVAVGEHEATQTVRVEDDPRIEISAADRKAQFDALQRMAKLAQEMDRGHKKAADLIKQVSVLQKSLKKSKDVPETVTTAVDALFEKAEGVEKKLTRRMARFDPSQERPLFFRLAMIYRALDGYTEAPSTDQLQRIDAYAEELHGQLNALKEVVETDVPNLNRLLQENHVSRITTAAR